MKTTLMGLALILSACADNGSGGGFGGSDSLPKRGERDTDPTIVSARAECDTYSTGSQIVLYVIASDPSGELGSCHADMAGTVAQNTFGDDNDCFLVLNVACTTMPEMTVDLLIANDRAGLTDASVTLPIQH